MTRGKGRTQSCTRSDAVLRLEHARKFLEVAELCGIEDEVPASSSVAAALAVLAGIAASDAACCAVFARRSRGQDHHDAEQHLAEIRGGGREAAKQLRRLLDLKDTAHDGLIHVSGAKLTSALGQAKALVLFADQTVKG